RFLVSRGAWFDIFIAVGLRDRALIERSLLEDSEALDHRIWHGKYTTVHPGHATETKPAIGDHRGDIYRWGFQPNAAALDVASALAFDDVVELLLARATPRQRLLHACATGNRTAADTVVAANPEIVSTLTPEQQRLICDRAYDNHTAAVGLML